MENKKGVYANPRSISTSEAVIGEAVPKHVHQHNTAPQHLCLLQYGLKFPNRQLSQLNQQPLRAHHQHQHQSCTTYQPLPHRHSQLPSHQHQIVNTSTVQPSTIQPQLTHQHQQKFEAEPSQNHFYYQKPVQSPTFAHSLNQLNQQNAQIWVPHQHPTHYHKQQVQLQRKPDAQPQVHLTKFQGLKKEIERKKSAGSSNQQLRSPSAKRPLEAPVTIQGWLYKQGSEGLMLWKKRWFVLSEYCLFYYKGAEEEKLLGSILLPSYKVSVCSPEDKINRKYAFKCEHANMRTYILAADSQKLMMQWVHLLSMACLLQSTTESNEQLQTSQSSATPVSKASSFKQSFQIQNVQSTPIHMHSSSNTTEISSPSQQELGQYSQPLYANAPPKPRRLTDGYSSPNFELDRYSADRKYGPLPQSHSYNMQDVYVTRGPTKSPINVYGNPQVISEYLQHGSAQQPLYNKHLHLPDYGISPVRDSHNVERRTPDSYGRSKLNLLKSRPSDYEDVYTEESYKQPLSCMAYYSAGKEMLPTSTKNDSYVSPRQMLRSAKTIPRPHSADFLEYEVKHQEPNVIARQPRPKSSLDINRNTSNDNYFYSEERYAEKMRKSAQYLPKIAKQHYLLNEYSAYRRSPAMHRSFDTETNFQLAKSNSHSFKTQMQNLYFGDVQIVRSRSVLSDGSLSKEVDMNNFDKEISNVFQNRHEQSYAYDEDIPRPSKDYDPFVRSASARLVQSSSQLGGRSFSREGERKREESMKRLLEWKQRMLQSPLNRKVNQIGKVTGKLSNYYRNNQLECSQPNMDIYSDTRKATALFPQYNSYSSDDEASGSISINTRDTFPQTLSAKKICTVNTKPVHSKSITNLSKGYENDYLACRSQQGCCIDGQLSNQHDTSLDNPHLSALRRANWQLSNKMNVSAGELLGRTHEELILLLIQLRRQSANTSNAIESCYNEIDSVQTKLPKMDAAKRLENLQKLEQIKQHLLELEKQYEKGKPLVNLVDNMVKLGSLYRLPKNNNSHPYVRDRLEFNQQMQERRLLADERRDWNRLSPNHMELQAKVQQLYHLDRLIQQESETLQGLQHDKEEIEQALGGLRHRLIKGFKDPAEVEQAQKQQMMLENELTRVHSMLAQNSRKLEETVAGNARLEQELLVLKQKLQISRHQQSSPQVSNAGDSLPCVIGTSTMLESDLHKVQQKVGDLHRQRQELSMQVKQLTDRSNVLHQTKISSALPSQLNQGNKKRINSLWRETDLDTMRSIDHGESWDHSASANVNKENHRYVMDKSNDPVGDDLSCHEKQEIKTVRIVKRESERRQKDREKTTAGKWDAVVEEDDLSQCFNPFAQRPQSNANLETLLSCSSESGGILNRQLSLSNPTTDIPTASSGVDTGENVHTPSELSPVFKSEAARQIIIEMSSQQAPKANRRIIPKEKRRHYTAPYNNLIMKSLHQLPTDDKDFDKLDVSSIRRARDDLDMERALRQRIDAPDVVRSTLGSKELKYNESTIDNILGTPNKIFIPERYVPEQVPQLSVEEQQHRLRKVESIKKMLSDTAIISGSSANLIADDSDAENISSSVTTSKATSKMIEEKKQREHLLQLNQILAKQVMEMSKIVAGSNNPGD